MKQELYMGEVNAPVVIGGSGGSGTRVLSELLMMSGFYMGARQNVSCDALDFVGFYDQWLNKYGFGRSAMSTMDESSMHAVFKQSMDRFNEGLNLSDSLDWGWKNPRSMLILPFLNDCLPDMKFIHLVRDGRDMVCSKNKNQFEKHGDLILSDTQQGYSAEEKAMYFWSESNMLVAEYGEAFMGERYMRIRFEDLCLHTEKTLNGLESFLGRLLNNKEFTGFIHTPKSVGRWLERSKSCQVEFMHSGEKAMRYFAYLD